MLANNIFQMEHSENAILRPLKNTECKQIIESFGLNVNDFYETEGKLYPYCYSRGTVLVEIYQMSKGYFEDFRVKEIITQRERIHQECIRNKDYNHLFILIDKPFRFSFFKKLFDEIPVEQRYDIFKTIYTSSEYGFNKLSRDFLEEIFKCNHSDKKWFDEDVITIYRGEGDKSTPYNRAYSWTTSIAVANWFAKRFNSNGKVYKGHVKQADILDYIADSNEKEVLVFPENVFDVELL